MISCAMKTHIPREADSFCCSYESKWWARGARRGSDVNGDLLRPAGRLVVGVGLLRHDGRRVEVLERRGGARLPLEARGTPRVVRGLRPPLERPEEIEEGEEVAEAEDRGASRRHDVPDLELRGIGVVTARHPEVPQDELRQERRVEPDEDDGRRDLREGGRVHPAGDLRPPEVEAAEV